MANDVYSPTTVSDPKSSFFLGSGSQFLDKVRFPLKVSEVLLSLVAFALEESVSSCSSCHSLYFFEFVSCTAFLFTALLLILLATTLHSKVGLSCWPKVVSCCRTLRFWFSTRSQSELPGSLSCRTSSTRRPSPCSSSSPPSCLRPATTEPPWRPSPWFSASWRWRRSALTSSSS
ncbi:CKLF-like MARVEL transmembrane domain-containing protein 6 isoform X2 [Fundulus heteroclitus]|uniref:CKLF-like MARVEL transmembrane domain-containing protein 6 isoform X2 n=1 Tax=Fundulus heteroclitus TaxID=8078 RepID=UPI00165C27F4|nr:CKLF-like MARVEL transmembrane domain-containing protein 6 isoform X2 [Fundulus heteroclitus]